MFEKKLYTLWALLSLSCSAYAMEEGIDKDKSTSLVSVRSAPSLKKSTSFEETQTEHEKRKAQTPKVAKFTLLELLRMATASGPFH